MIRFYTLTLYWAVRDRRTDKRTDISTMAKTALSNVSRCKMKMLSCNTLQILTGNRNIENMAHASYTFIKHIRGRHC